MHKTLNNRARTAGFTLVEIMIVVAIIGLLAAIAIPNMNTGRIKAARTGCQLNLRAIAGAKQNWALENKKASSDVPADGDLFGADKFLPDKPACPGGGTYALNAVSEKPACSIPDHNY